MWLDCIVVVSRWCCKEVYRFPHIMQQHPYFFVQFLSVFVLVELNEYMFMVIL